MDLVRIIEDICTDLGYQFHYGNKSHLNLIDQNGELAPNKIHLLLFPITRGRINKDTSSRIVSGNFFFVMPDEFAQDYYNNTTSSETSDKFTTKIEPLITSLDGFQDRLDYCENVEVRQFQSVEVVDILDANLSGFWVTFNVEVYE